MATLRKSEQGGTLGRDAAAALAVGATGTAAAIAVSLLLARVLGASGYGAYSWALASTAALSALATRGFDQLLVRDVAVFVARSDWSGVHGLWRRAQSRVVAGGVGLAVAIAAGIGIAHAAVPHELIVPLLVALPAIPLVALGTIQQGFAQGLHRPVAGLIAWSLIRQGVLALLVTSAVVIGGLSAGGACALAIAAMVVAALVCTRTLRRVLPSVPAREAAHGWTRQALPMAVVSCVAVIDAQVGLVALGALDGTTATGLFAAASQMTVGFVLVSNAAGRPLAPLLATLHHASGRDRLQAELTRATRWVAAATAAGAVVACLAARPLLSVLGPEFERARTAFVLLACAHVVNAFVAFNGTVLMVTGHAGVVARTAIGSLALDVVLLAVLVPTLGLNGAAIAFLVTVVVKNLVNSRAARRELGLSTGAVTLRAQVRHA